MTTKISDLRLVAFCLAELISIYIEFNSMGWSAVTRHLEFFLDRPVVTVRNEGGLYIIDLKVEWTSTETEKI